MLGSFGLLFGVVLGSCWGNFGIFLRSLKRYLFKCTFRRALDASWGPSWAQVGPQVGPSWAQNRHLTSLKFQARFWSDFEASWARFWEPFGLEIEPKNELKIGRVKKWKFAFRVDGSSIFDAPGGPKSMKIRCKNDFKIGPHLKSEKNSKKLPT